MNNKDHFYQHIIIGGGIVGAGILRELASKNKEALLLEKSTFSSQTSRSSSKMLHGGIRYLENFDIDLVQEALRERNYWLEEAPRFCKKITFSIPIYKSDARPFWYIVLGTWFYQFLSTYKIIFNRFWYKEEVIEKTPQIKTTDLKGAAIYEDVVVDDLGLAKWIIDSSVNKYHHAMAKENCELKSLKKISSEGIYLLEIFNHQNQTTEHYRCKKLIFATGPFTDQLFKNLNAFSWNPKLILSKGIHLWIKRSSLQLSSAVVLTPADGRVIFIIPYNDKILIGTTESEISAPEFDIAAKENEITYLLKNINEYFPTAQIDHNDIIDSFAGIRPLVQDDSSSVGQVARHHKIYQPDNNIYAIMGGKYTTFRVMAEDLVRML